MSEFKIDTIVDVLSAVKDTDKLRDHFEKLEKKIESGFQSAQKGAEQFSQRLGIAETRLRSFGSRAQSSGLALTAGLTAPIVGVGAAAIKMATDMDAGMARIATLIPGNIQRIKELRTEVQQTAIQTGQSTAAVADGLFQLISAYGDSADAAQKLRIASEAATAGNATVAESVNLLSAVTKGYGDTSAGALKKVADLSFVTNKLGQTTFPELAASMGKVVPLSKALKISQEEMFGVFATGTGVTGNTAEVATQYRGVLQSLLAPTEDMSKLFDDLHVSSGKALIEQRGLKGAIDAIVAASEKSGLPLQKYIQQVEGQTLALALAGAQSETFAAKTEAMRHAVGASKEAFKEQTQGINRTGFEFSQLNRRIEKLSQNFGEKLLPAVNDVLLDLPPLIEKLGVLTEKFGELSPATRSWVVQISGVLAVLGPVTLGIGLLARGVGTFLGFVKGVGAPITLYIASLILLTSQTENAFSAQTDLAERVRINSSLLGNLAAAATGPIGPLLKLSQTWATGLEFLKVWREQGLLPAIAAVQNANANLHDFRSELDSFFMAAHSSTFTDIKDAYKQLGDSIFDLVVPEKKFTAQQEALIAAFHNSVDPTAELTKKIETLRKAHASDVLIAKVLNKQILAATDTAKKYRIELNHTVASLEALARAQKLASLDSNNLDVNLTSVIAHNAQVTELERQRKAVLDAMPASLQHLVTLGLQHADSLTAQAIAQANMNAAATNGSDAATQFALDMDKLDRQTRINAGTAVKWGDVWSRQVSTISTDFSRGLFDIVKRTKTFGETMIDIALQIGEAMFRALVEKFFNPFKLLLNGKGAGGGITAAGGSILGGLLGALTGGAATGFGVSNFFGGGLPGIALGTSAGIFGAGAIAGGGIGLSSVASGLGSLFGGAAPFLAAGIVPGLLIGGIGLLARLFSKSPQEKAFGELGRDFPGVSGSQSDINSFITQVLGLNLKQVQDIRKPTDTLFALTRGFGPNASQADQQALIAALAHFQVAQPVGAAALAAGVPGSLINGGKDIVFDLSEAARKAIEQGDVKELADQLKQILAGDKQFAQLVPTFGAVIDQILGVADATKEAADATNQLTAAEQARQGGAKVFTDVDAQAQALASTIRGFADEGISRLNGGLANTEGVLKLQTFAWQQWGGQVTDVVGQLDALELDVPPLLRQMVDFGKTIEDNARRAAGTRIFTDLDSQAQALALTIRAFADEGISRLDGGLDNTRGVVALQKFAWEQWGSAVESLVHQMAELGLDIPPILEQMVAWGNASEVAAQATNDAAAAAERMHKLRSEGADFIDNIIGRGQDLADTLFGAGTEAIRISQEQGIPIVELQIEAWKKWGDQIEAWLKTAHRLGIEVPPILEQAHKFALQQHLIKATTDPASNSLLNQAQQLGKLREQYQQVARAANQFSDVEKRILSDQERLRLQGLVGGIGARGIGELEPVVQQVLHLQKTLADQLLSTSIQRFGGTLTSQAVELLRLGDFSSLDQAIQALLRPLPRLASGGTILETGAAIVHRGERVVPAGEPTQVSVVFSPVIQTSAGSDPQAVVRALRRAWTEEFAPQLERTLEQNGRIRTKIRRIRG